MNRQIDYAMERGQVTIIRTIFRFIKGKTVYNTINKKFAPNTNHFGVIFIEFIDGSKSAFFLVYDKNNPEDFYYTQYHSRNNFFFNGVKFAF